MARTDDEHERRQLREQPGTITTDFEERMREEMVYGAARPLPRPREFLQHQCTLRNKPDTLPSLTLLSTLYV